MDVSRDLVMVWLSGQSCSMLTFSSELPSWNTISGSCYDVNVLTCCKPSVLFQRPCNCPCISNTHLSGQLVVSDRLFILNVFTWILGQGHCDSGVILVSVIQEEKCSS